MRKKNNTRKKTNILAKAWKDRKVHSKTKRIKDLESKLKKLRRERLAEYRKALKRLKK
jgi:hypothetical protein